MADAWLTVSLRLSTTTPSGRDAEFSASGTVITFRGFLAAYRGEPRRRVEKEEEAAAPAPEGQRRAEGSRARARGHATTPPARFTEASLVERSRSGESDARPHTPRSWARSSTAATSSSAAPRSSPPSLPSLSPDCSSSTSAASSTTRSPQMEDDLDRIAAGSKGAGRLAPALLLRRRRRRPRLRACLRPLRDRRACGQLASARRQRDRASCRPLRAVGVARSARASRRTPSPDELTVEKAEELALRTLRRPRARCAPGWGTEIARRWPGIRAVRDRGAAGGRDREAAHGLAVVDVARDGDAGRGDTAAPLARRVCSAPIRRRRRGGGAERPLQPLRQEGHRGRGRSRPRSSCSRSRSTRRSRCSRSRRAAAARRSRRCAARPGSGQREASCAQGRPFRPLRDRRRDECGPTAQRRSRDRHDRAGGRAARRQALEGAGAEASAAASARPRRALTHPDRRANFPCQPAS